MVKDDKVDNISVIQNNVFNTIIIHTDGSCKYFNKNNKYGELAIGFIVNFDDKYKYEYFEKIGIGTSSNVVEYEAILSALRFLIENNIKANLVILKSDALIIINYINGQHYTKSNDLIRINHKFKNLLQKITNSVNIKDIKFEWVEREQNREADKAASKAFKNIPDINIDKIDIDKRVNRFISESFKNTFNNVLNNISRMNSIIIIYIEGVCGNPSKKRTRRRRMKIKFVVNFNNGYEYMYYEKKGSCSSDDIVEYNTFISVLEFLIINNIQAKEIVFKFRSQLIIDQINKKNYRFYDNTLFILNNKTKKLLYYIKENFGNIRLEYVSIEKGKEYGKPGIKQIVQRLVK